MSQLVSEEVKRGFPSSLCLNNKGWQHKQGKKRTPQVFLGGAVVGNPPANAGDVGSIPGPGRSHMPQSN